MHGISKPLSQCRYRIVNEKQLSLSQCGVFVCFLFLDDKLGWYQRWENNGWRLVSDRVMKRVDQDPVVYESTLKKEFFSHNKVREYFSIIFLGYLKEIM